ncbi:hypothetical protein NAEGRDRAFT_82958 [Naegleria gruberi]|uniref:Uncharacterized protein FM164 n=1 Tax=Naegleria gruberi TaxID=5762 RepID=D2V2U0_NAEGR|nr:uncharacterized protein NAEGRDRAFT_82958 [Naegleria gruberi]EFC49119.1 hypothetical protein NAEGRDRAFT_82958 [Naegleria gruberi]|eukprot:XP_002681863.1 hypothetical protein NAEGRDRAFT_82958 [Naegleria gruberi strain NEG-M]
MAGKKSTKKKDPNAPKKPKTGYFLFCDEHREAAKAKTGEKKSASEVSKVLGEMWNSLSDEQKKPYNDKYKKSLDGYNAQMEEYKKNKPSSEDEEESDSDGEKKKRKRGSKKAKKDKDAPKRPLTSYMIFSQEMRKKLLEEDSTLKVTEVAKKVGALWKKMSDEQKKPYIAQAEKLKAAYKVQKEEYDATHETKAPAKKKTKKESESEEEESSEEESDDE